MNRKILERGVDTRELFTIEWDGEKYYAVRTSNPRFCLSGDSIAEASDAAARALTFVASLKRPQQPRDTA